MGCGKVEVGLIHLATNLGLWQYAWMRSQWWTLGFVFSPLALALLYSALIDGESFGAFIFGVLLSLIFGAAVLVRYIAKKQN